jgi:hypothetical protein
MSPRLAALEAWAVEKIEGPLLVTMPGACGHKCRAGSRH